MKTICTITYGTLSTVITCERQFTEYRAALIGILLGTIGGLIWVAWEGME